MSVKLVTFDHKAEGRNYDQFFDAIKSYDHVKLSEFAYAIDTPLPPSDVFIKLRPLIDSFTDRLFVAETTLLAQYHPMGDTYNWLMHRLSPK